MIDEKKEPDSLWVVTGERGEYSDHELKIISAHHRKDQAEDAVKMLEAAQASYLSTGRAPKFLENWVFSAEEIAGKSAVKDHILQLLENGYLL